MYGFFCFSAGKENKAQRGNLDLLSFTEQVTSSARNTIESFPLSSK